MKHMKSRYKLTSLRIPYETVCDSLNSSCFIRHIVNSSTCSMISGESAPTYDLACLICSTKYNQWSNNLSISRCFSLIFVVRVHITTNHQIPVDEHGLMNMTRLFCVHRRVWEPNPTPSINVSLRAHAVLPCLFLLTDT